MEILKNNSYYFGLTIPDPGSIIPMEAKVPTEMATPEGIKFLKVITKPLERGKANNNGMLRHSLDE